MAKRKQITQAQFQQIVSAVALKLFGKKAVLDTPVEPTDCDAVRAFVAAGQAILDRDCPILRPVKKVAVKK